MALVLSWTTVKIYLIENALYGKDRLVLGTGTMPDELEALWGFRIQF